MTSALITTPDAVKDVINSATHWSQPLAAERSYADWDLELTDNALHCDVVLAGAQIADELADRESVDVTVPVHIAIRKKFEQDQLVESTGRVLVTEIDDLVQVVDDLHLFFATDRFDEFPDVVWQETRLVSAFSREMLRTHRQFVGVLELLFTANQSIV